MSNYNKNIVKQYISKSKVVSFFILLNTLLFIVEIIMSDFSVRNISIKVLLTLGANMPEYVQQGQIYRLLTATVLHAGALHWLMNMAALLTLCSQV